MIAEREATSIHAFLFYRESSWPILFNRLLKPFIDDLLHQDRIAGFTLFLQKIRGDHIRMTLHAREAGSLYANTLKEDLKKDVHRFFSCCPSVATPPPSSGAYFFMDFPPNTLYFDLPDHRPRIWETQLPVDTGPLAQEVSQILLAGLSAEDADDTDLTTIALYLELALLKAMEPQLPADPGNNPEVAGSQLIEKALPNSGYILPELKKEIWAAGSNRLTWLDNWMELCAGIFAKTPGLNATEYTDVLSAELFRHFNIPSRLGAALHHELQKNLRTTNHDAT